MTPKNKEKRIIVTNLGLSGASPKLTLMAADALKQTGKNYKIVVSGGNDQIMNFRENHMDDLIEVPIFRKSDLFSVSKYLDFRKTLKALILDENDKILFMMPHPWDRFIKFNVTLIRVIHDFRRHPGDTWWPTTRSLRARIKLGQDLFVLSDYVGDAVEELGGKVVRLQHPQIDFEEVDVRINKVPNLVLFIGRQKKYKGGKLLGNAWPLVLENLPSAQLIVAGQGKIPNNLIRCSNIEVRNHWMSESEISRLFLMSEVVVFPYIESSQSGLIATAFHYNCKIVVTPIGGLQQQALLEGGFVAEDLSPNALAKEVQSALTGQGKVWNKPRLLPEQPDLIEFITRLH